MDDLRLAVFLLKIRAGSAAPLGMLSLQGLWRFLPDESEARNLGHILKVTLLVGHR